MKTLKYRAATAVAVAAFALLFTGLFVSDVRQPVIAQTTPAPTPTPPATAPVFDQAAALAKLREQIKGREQEPAGTVFKNVQMNKQMPAARLLAVMEMGYARSLGITCTHCHVPDKWESEENPNKQVARDMSAMVGRINNELLKGIKNLSQSPVVNCTTCHRGQVKPALNLPAPARTE